MSELIQEILSNPVGSLLVVVNLFLIESLLSVDNAAVLATMVRGLSRRDKVRALKYGLAGAYLFRGICLVLATYLVKIWWLKSLGGAYLVYLAVEWWLKKRKTNQPADVKDESNSKLYQMTVGKLGKFWATVITVELMDLAFSLDNVFAAVAYSRNILIILTGVFIGILAMRFVAQGFVKLMDLYPFLEGSAFLVIGMLGVKLVLSFYEHFQPEGTIAKFMESSSMEWLTSALTIAIFIVPILTSYAFNFPKHERASRKIEH